MADSDTTDQAQANNVADQPPFQAVSLDPTQN
jgi:hypothetical protein